MRYLRLILVIGIGSSMSCAEELQFFLEEAVTPAAGINFFPEKMPVQKESVSVPHTLTATVTPSVSQAQKRAETTISGFKIMLRQFAAPDPKTIVAIQKKHQCREKVYLAELEVSDVYGFVGEGAAVPKGFKDASHELGWYFVRGDCLKKKRKDDIELDRWLNSLLKGH